MRKPDICFLQYDLRGGGAERKVCTLANYFVSRGKTVDIGLFGKNMVAYAVDPRVNITYIRRDSFEYRNEAEKRGADAYLEKAAADPYAAGGAREGKPPRLRLFA